MSAQLLRARLAVAQAQLALAEAEAKAPDGRVTQPEGLGD